MGIAKLTGPDLNTVRDESDTHVLEPHKQQVFHTCERATSAKHHWRGTKYSRVEDKDTLNFEESATGMLESNEKFSCIVAVNRSEKASAPWDAIRTEGKIYAILLRSVICNKWHNFLWYRSSFEGRYASVGVFSVFSLSLFQI